MGCGSVSQGRTAAATVVVPVVALPEARTPSGTTLRPVRSLCSLPPPIATRLTGSSKLTLTAVPRLGLSSAERMCAAGVTTVSVRSSLRPTSQPIQLGRLISTWTVTRSPGAEPNARPDGAAAQHDRHRLARASPSPRSARRAPRSRAARFPRGRSATRRRRRSARPATPPLRQPRRRGRDTPAVRNHLRNTTHSVSPTLRTEMAGPDGGQRGPARALTRRDRRFSAQPADRAARLPRRRSHLRRPAHLRLRRRRSRRGHDRGPQDRDAARKPARVRRGRRVRRRRQGKLAERDRPRAATKSSPATRSSPHSPSCASASRAPPAAPRSRGRSGRTSSCSASTSRRCRAGPSSGDFLCVSRE